MKKYIIGILFSLLVQTCYFHSSVYAEKLSSVLDKVCVIRSAMNNNYVIDVYYMGKENGTNIQLYHYNGAGDSGEGAQKFIISSAGNGYYKIVNTHSNKAIDVSGGVAGNEVNVHLWEYNGTDAQKFKFESAGNGYYYIKNKLGYYLDVYGAKCEDWTNIQTYQKNGGNNQKWLLTFADVANKGNHDVEISLMDDTLIFNKHRYKVFNEGRDWDNAKIYCQNIGGHLATIGSKEEQEALEQLLKAKGTKNSYWIGGYEDFFGKWVWVTGEKLGYTNWVPWQPDNPRIENKLMMYRLPNPNITSNLGQWNDLRANGTYPNEAFFGLRNFGFICEWENDDDVIFTTKDVTLGDFSTIDEWRKRMREAEGSVTGFSSFVTMNELQNDYARSVKVPKGKIIIRVDVLSYKTIKVRDPRTSGLLYDIGGKSSIKYLDLKFPKKVRFTLHEHKFKTANVWFNFSTLSYSTTCSCGLSFNHSWDVPYPDNLPDYSAAEINIRPLYIETPR